MFNEEDRQEVEKKLIKYMDKTDTCWNWTACILRNGYGQTYWKGKKLYGHRVSYEIYVGKIPDGLVIDHLCRNRKCINPAHLEAVTGVENNLRAMKDKSRFEGGFCKHGHKLTRDNIYMVKGRWVSCMACNRMKQVRFAAKHNNLPPN